MTETIAREGNPRDTAFWGDGLTGTTARGAAWSVTPGACALAYADWRRELGGRGGVEELAACIAVREPALRGASEAQWAAACAVVDAAIAAGRLRLAGPFWVEPGS